MTLLEVSAWTGGLACALLAYRIVSTWRLTSSLTKAVGSTLLLVLVGQAYGSTQTIHTGVTHLPPNVVQVVFAGRVLVVALCLLWPWRG